ncbi:WD40/YVTN/BNR-like repeat-containing protein [Corallococcus carmarthensis]|uniref:WD40/YVTN/BNR-like repeat-containing protein n=1 Tax=Corallococcus carmarthensis TaxID=2316728 RepID=UPI00148BD976|nr:sialidase family protein [Corallococcus carmarthensis]NOK23335.1 exo-alpha-sialidase [Corallococcus carmarthensis]
MVPAGGGNALTLPAHRHAVRIETGNGHAPTWLLAIQQQGAEGEGLNLFRSEDGFQGFTKLAEIQPDASHHDRAELVAVGRDVAVVYAYEAPSLAASSRHDVYFQWWRYDEAQDTWTPEPAVRVFNADSTTAYSRALLARDSRGRLWVQAFRLESDGGATAVVAVSTDGGASFQRQPDLGRTRKRGGGRLLSVGSKLVFFWAMHDGFEPTRLRVRDAADPLDTWGPQRDAFSDGIYHGAALSAVEDGKGGIHLVYKDETERLYYRRFDGTSFGSRILVEGTPDWALQPAVTRIGDALYVFYNHFQTATDYEIQVRVLRNGAFSDPVTLDSRTSFKGYLSTLDVLPDSVTEVPCFYGDAVDANSSGRVMRVALPRQPEGGGGSGQDGGTSDGGGGGIDGGAGTPDGGSAPDAGTPDAGTDGGVDAGTPPVDGGVQGPVTLEPVFTNTTHEVLAVDGAGTVYALALDGSRSKLWASTDGGRTFSARGQGLGGASFWVMAVLKDGTLLAQMSRSGSYHLERSTDGGATWADVAALGSYRAMSPASFAELGNTVFFLEYQTFTSANTPLRLWASTDGGVTWAVRATFQDHRHGTALYADATRSVLWATFGSSSAQAAVKRSTDGGRTWTKVMDGYAANAVTGEVLAGGELLLGQSTLYEPEHPKLLRVYASGRVDALMTLPGPAYSLNALPGGGFVLGTARADVGDVQPASDVYARLFTSTDGVAWLEARRFERATSTSLARAEVWGVLPNGDLVVRAENLKGFGTGGKGFQVLRVKR